MYRILVPTFAAILLMILAPALMLLLTGDYPGSTRFYGIEEDAEFVGFLFNLRK